MLGPLVYKTLWPDKPRAQQNFGMPLDKWAIAPSLLATLGCAAGFWVSLAAGAIATPVLPDGSTNSTVLDAVTNAPSNCSVNCVIQGTDQAGGNLYHSFSRFNVPSGVTVTFDGQGLERILMRVTEREITHIDGLLQVQGKTDLFLLNSAGIVMGADARLDISGSFIGSTAEAVLFENGDVFVTPIDEAPLLSISIPNGLQFNYLPRNTTGTFAIRGNASQPPLWQPGTLGETFALVIDSSIPATFVQRSHAVTAGGFVLANAGADRHRVNLAKTAVGWDFDFSDVDQVRAVEINQAAITTSPESPGGIVELDGEVTLNDSQILLESQAGIEAGDFQFRGASLTLNSSRLATQTSSGGGNINLLMEIDGQELNLRNNSTIETASGLGQAGNINFEGRKVNLLNSAITTKSQSGGGNISLLASDAIALTNNSLLSVASNAGGTVGDITLEALGPGGFQLNDSQILSTVETAGGDISILAPDNLSFTRGELIASTDLAGANGSLRTDGSLFLNDGDLISLNSGDGTYAGTGGNLVIEASQVDSAGRDTDIKVVGPAGNFTTVISSSPNFFGFAGFRDVIRGNRRSEIQITELAPFPLPATPPTLPPSVPITPNPITPGPITPGPITPEPVVRDPIILEPVLPEPLIPETVVLDPIISARPEQPSTGDVPVMIQPTTPVPETPVEETNDGGNQQDHSLLFWLPILGGNSDNNEELTLAGSSDAAYQARRPSCESEIARRTQGRLLVTGRGGLPAGPGSLMTLGQSLADLGRSGLALRQGRGQGRQEHLRRDWPIQVGNNALERGSQLRLREAGGWQRTASGKIQLLAGVQDPAMAAVKPCHSISVGSRKT